MKMTKLVAAAAGLICAAALTLTSCGSFGKDDFFGTWNTEYTVTSDNVTTYGTTNNSVGSTVKMTMYFDGKSENLVTNGGAKFWQYKIRTTSAGKEVKTFWFGTYKLQDNANYENGTLILNYMYGCNTPVEQAEADALAALWIDGTIADAMTGDTYDSTLFPVKYDADTYKETGVEGYIADLLKAKDADKNSGYYGSIQLDETNECTDVEAFSFELGGQKITGYTTMSAEAKDADEKKGWDECTWEVAKRDFTLVSTKSALSDALSSLIKTDEETE